MRRNTTRLGTSQSVQIGDLRLKYLLVRSPAARHLRVRVGVKGIEVIQPSDGHADDSRAFVVSNGQWVLEQLRRIEALRGLRKQKTRTRGEILFRGQPTPIKVALVEGRRGPGRVVLRGGELIVTRGENSLTPASRTLENWLRKQARREVETHLTSVTRKLDASPRKLYIMDQRTKWGNCSASRNLSFNWRLILAPDSVLRYLVTHEAVHLAVPNHSAKFWLTVQGLCPDMERSKVWLRVHVEDLLTNLDEVIPG